MKLNLLYALIMTSLLTLNSSYAQSVQVGVGDSWLELADDACPERVVIAAIAGDYSGFYLTAQGATQASCDVLTIENYYSVPLDVVVKTDSNTITVHVYPSMRIQVPLR